MVVRISLLYFLLYARLRSFTRVAFEVAMHTGATDRAATRDSGSAAAGDVNAAARESMQHSSSDSGAKLDCLDWQVATELAKDALGLETVGQTHERNS